LPGSFLDIFHYIMVRLLLLPCVAVANRESTGLLQMSSAQLHQGGGAEGMLTAVKSLVQQNGEKPSASTLAALEAIEDGVDEIMTALTTEHTNLQTRATDATAAIEACDAAWTQADGRRSSAETTMNEAESAHSGCRTEESSDLAVRTTDCGAMNSFHNRLGGLTCDEPNAFDRDNSVVYFDCLSDFHADYAQENTDKIAACVAAEDEYTRQQGECNGKQGAFEEGACAHYTSHAAMCAAYGDCRPPAVQDFEAKNTAIGLEETSLKNQYKVLQTVKCYVGTMRSDDTDTTAAALAANCESQETNVDHLNIDYKTEPAAKGCVVGSRPCEATWLSSHYDSLPADAGATDCSACPEYTATED